MIPQKKKAGSITRQTAVKIFTANCICFFTLFSFACSEFEKPTTEPFYSQTAPPMKQEFRWSNGKMPKSFDPALASAAPETDVVRAVFEGLTDANPKTLEVIPAIATEWSAAENNTIWTFKLRRNAKWSNGKTVTAEDFVRSWKRLAEIRNKVSHPTLLKNIVGMPVDTEIKKEELPAESPDFLMNQLSGKNPSPSNSAVNSNSSIIPPKYEIIVTDNLNKPVINKPITEENKSKNDPKLKSKTKIETKFGVEAIDDFTLKVSLINPDKDFPQLVAHPMMRPVFGNGKEFETEKLNAEIVTNGAFRIVSIGQDGITLDRTENFWNKEIRLERVKFVPTENAEKALEAYRAGTIDAVTNVNFEPLAVKLLQPFDDFQRTTHSALNFYEFNRKNAPFNDRRVREALAISIVRERLTEGEMEGASKPALSFLPYEVNAVKLTQNVDKARNLLTAAGFPGGEDFPKILLVINRNNTQQKIARSVAKMWKENLNIDTEIIIKEANELAEIKQKGDYDLIRRGVVLPTTDENANMTTIFEPKAFGEKIKETAAEAADKTTEIIEETERSSVDENSNSAILEVEPDKDAESETSETDVEKNILTEETAIIELHAIPLYFPTSYSLVKPYVQGFEMNTLDAPSLKSVTIDNNWQPKKTKSES
jgi:oligopeptide transport system substrate-binding protein